VCPHCENKHRNTWLWPLYKHLRITRVPTVFSRNLPLCRITKSLLCTDLKRCIWKFYQIFSPSLFETLQANVKISFFLLGLGFFKILPCTPQHPVQIARLSFKSSESGHPTPSPARECCSSLLRVQGGRLTCLRGKVGGPIFDQGINNVVF
jgi:hypothetical protein